ncbi:hypothetical protein V2W45_1473803 [Cenococcum geophilum]
MDLYGNNRWWFQSSINPLYLSTIPAPTPTHSTRRKPIDRKTDYRTALFSGFEVKPASGDHTEAELQMTTTMVEPALTIVGHEHSIYYAYPREDLVSRRSGVHILGPDLDRFERLSTDSIRGVFRLVRLHGNLLKYGMDEGEDGYWGQFFGSVLDKLASISEDRDK